MEAFLVGSRGWRGGLDACWAPSWMPLVGVPGAAEREVEGAVGLEEGVADGARAEVRYMQPAPRASQNGSYWCAAHSRGRWGRSRIARRYRAPRRCLLLKRLQWTSTRRGGIVKAVLEGVSVPGCSAWSESRRGQAAKCLGVACLEAGGEGDEEGEGEPVDLLDRRHHLCLKRQAGNVIYKSVDIPPEAIPESGHCSLPSFLCSSLSAKLLAREKLFLNIVELRRTDPVSLIDASYGGVGGVATMTESSEDDPMLSRGSAGSRRLLELLARESRFVR